MVDDAGNIKPAKALLFLMPPVVWAGREKVRGDRRQKMFPQLAGAVNLGKRSSTTDGHQPAATVASTASGHGYQTLAKPAARTE